MKITVLGSGSWGTALGLILVGNNHDVSMWARREALVKSIEENRINERYLPGIKLPETMVFTSDIIKSIENSDVILFASASQALREVLGQIKEVIRPETIIVNVAKGIENDTLKRPSEIVKALVPDNTYVVLSGPSHAEEVALGIPTTLVSASESRDAAELVQDLFTTNTLRVYTNPDVVGVELGGALKNIIALGAGISDGLGFGDNAKAALMTRGISEITKLGLAMGARFETFQGLSGIGDLIVTCTSMHSRNRRCGIKVGEGVSVDQAVESIGMVVEGIYAIKAAYDLSVKENIEMPITKELYDVFYKDCSARESVKKLMLRKRKHEIEESTTW